VSTEPRVSDEGVRLFIEDQDGVESPRLAFALDLRARPHRACGVTSRWRKLLRTGLTSKCRP